MRRAAAPTVSARMASKRLIRFLSTTRNMTLDLVPKGRLVLTAVADAGWAGIAERRSVTGRLGTVGWMLCYTLVSN